MGFKKDAIITFRTPYNYQHPDNKQFVLQQKIRSIAGIQKLSLAGPPPANQGYNISTMKMIGKNGKEIESSVEVKQADTNYFELYKMKFLAGRNLQQSDTTKEYVINETYCRILGYKDPADIIGQTLAHGDRKIPSLGSSLTSIRNHYTPLFSHLLFPVRQKSIILFTLPCHQKEKTQTTGKKQ
jgi:hypothetical protein